MFQCSYSFQLIEAQEINAPFYFTPSKLASAFHCCSPSLNDLAYAKFALYCANWS